MSDTKTSEEHMRSLFRPVPVRLLEDARFMRLASVPSDLLQRLYLICDRRGRGPADPELVRSKTGRLSMSTEEVRLTLLTLAAKPSPEEPALLRIYPDTLNGGVCFQLHRYWQDLTDDMRRKAGASIYPDPPVEMDDRPAPPDWTWEEIWPDAPDEARPLGRPDSAPRAPRRLDGDIDSDETKTTRVLPARAHAYEPEPERQLMSPGAGAAIDLAGQTDKLWPSEDHFTWGVKWQKELWARAPMNGHHLVTEQAICAVANLHPQSFIAACQVAIKAGAAWPGWSARWPLNWLRKGAEIEARPAPPRERTPRGPVLSGHERKEVAVEPMSLADFERSLEEQGHG